MSLTTPLRKLTEVERKQRVDFYARETEILRQREESALDALHGLGFRIGLYQPRKNVEADPLRGIEAGWKRGQCYAFATSTTGKTKSAGRPFAPPGRSSEDRAPDELRDARCSPGLRRRRMVGVGGPRTIGKSSAQFGVGLGMISTFPEMTASP